MAGGGGGSVNYFASIHGSTALSDTKGLMLESPGIKQDINISNTDLMVLELTVQAGSHGSVSFGLFNAAGTRVVRVVEHGSFTYAIQTASEALSVVEGVISASQYACGASFGLGSKIVISGSGSTPLQDLLLTGAGSRIIRTAFSGNGHWEVTVQFETALM